MTSNIITTEDIKALQTYLIREEKSKATIEKYMRDTKRFIQFVDSQPVTKEIVMGFKKHLISTGLATSSINSILASINSLLKLLGMDSCKVKNLRTQQKVYCDVEKELTKAEYIKLVKAARDNPRLELIIQTICGTGIRVSELEFFTVESVRKGEVTVSCKNKIRTILIPKKLKQMLISYTRRNGINSGIIFRTKNDQPMNRSNIWREMKNLCVKAGVKVSKVFPHNLRKLFARTFYNHNQDIAKLADILGHSSINTTRIYIMTSGKEHMKWIENLGLLVNVEMKRDKKIQHN